MSLGLSTEPVLSLPKGSTPCPFGGLGVGSELLERGHFSPESLPLLITPVDPLRVAESVPSVSEEVTQLGFFSYFLAGDRKDGRF